MESSGTGTGTEGRAVIGMEFSLAVVVEVEFTRRRIAEAASSLSVPNRYYVPVPVSVSGWLTL
jgi:hypothetical protein